MYAEFEKKQPKIPGATYFR